ncbi:Dabb family protein [Plebeiibacterium marinum]|uniref:Dabb family protein n=1 Tax=Plebeiibacterium marinum TaxID=2992111 RepID=A0AAE3MGC9_9BACT|nr:Dabb family protein [Plebeiobacterium marinum]MCW3807147.1 Dabb family protein [Plebeiobacterium marinum]
MIKHVVLWQLKEFATEMEKKQKIGEIKEALEALPEKIVEIKGLEVFVNANAAEKFDIMLESSFENLEELALYAKHPDHVAVGAIIKQAVVSRACVDYEI